MKKTLKLFLNSYKNFFRVLYMSFMTLFKIISDTYHYFFYERNYFKTEYYKDIDNRLLIQKTVDELQQTGEEFKDITLKSGKKVRISIETHTFLL